jgi:hypothetical protein
MKEKEERLREYILDNFEKELLEYGMTDSPEDFRHKSTAEADYEQWTEKMEMPVLMIVITDIITKIYTK